MFEATQVTHLQDIPAEALNSRHHRTPGAVGLILDPVVIREYVHSQLTDHECESPDDLRHCSSLQVEPMLLLRSPKGELAIIGSEGVADEVDESEGAVPAYVSIGWMYQQGDHGRGR